MKPQPVWRKRRIIGMISAFLAVVGLVLMAVLFHHDIRVWVTAAYRWVIDPEAVSQTINAFGPAAPLVFMGFQVMQVLVAPIPGELSGFVGGYLFGAIPGFFYSSIALAIGSWISFLIGRYFGNRFVRNWIPVDKLSRIDHILKRQGAVALLILFVMPGFPKDYLCLIFGMGKFPLKAFMIISAFGRMPGTLMLSFQGEFLFEQNYAVFGIMLVLAALVTAVTIRYREPLYRWMEKITPQTHTDD